MDKAPLTISLTIIKEYLKMENYVWEIIAKNKITKYLTYKLIRIKALKGAE